MMQAQRLSKVARGKKKLADGRDGGHNLAELQLVQDRGLASRIQTHCIYQQISSPTPKEPQATLQGRAPTKKIK